MLPQQHGIGFEGETGWKFHSVHGDRITIENNGLRAVRSPDAGGSGIIFSDRVIAIDEQMALRFYNVSAQFPGFASIGVTSKDPTSLTSEALVLRHPYAHRDEDWFRGAMQGYWIKKLPLENEPQGSKVQFSVTSRGEIHYSINGVNKGRFLRRLPATRQLWLVVDLSLQSDGEPVPAPIPKPVEVPQVPQNPVKKEDKKETSNDKETSSIDNCVVCLEKLREMALIPCGHLAMCVNCTANIRRIFNICPMCRGTINDVLKIYTS